MKNSVTTPTSILKEIRSALDELEVEKPKGAGSARSAVKALGLKPASVRAVARDFAARHRATLDLPTAVAVVDAAIARKVREEIIVALELLDRFRKEFPASLFSTLDKWVPVADDLEVAEALGSRVAAPLLVAEVAGLLRSSTKVDAKAVQDFLFRRSIDGNPEILRAGSENLDAARRAALIAKLEAQAGIVPLAAAAGR